jgi:hypothetical protein
MHTFAVISTELRGVMIVPPNNIPQVPGADLIQTQIIP